MSLKIVGEVNQAPWIIWTGLPLPLNGAVLMFR